MPDLVFSPLSETHAPFATYTESGYQASPLLLYSPKLCYFPYRFQNTMLKMTRRDQNQRPMS